MEKYLSWQVIPQTNSIFFFMTKFMFRQLLLIKHNSLSWNTTNIKRSEKHIQITNRVNVLFVICATCTQHIFLKILTLKDQNFNYYFILGILKIDFLSKFILFLFFKQPRK